MNDRLRIAFVAGTLTQGGAEKQLLYMARSLQDAGVEVQIHSLDAGQFYEDVFRGHKLPVFHIPRRSNPALRTWSLARTLHGFRPHIIQSSHFFANLYVALAAKPTRSVSIGAIRCGATHEIKVNGRWGPWLLRSPQALIGNSHDAIENAIDVGVPPQRLHLVDNVIDIDAFECADCVPAECVLPTPSAIVVCNLKAAKRVDRFLSALQLARQSVPTLTGVIVGDGPELQNLREMARRLDLEPDGVRFLGRRNDIPSLLRTADMLIVSSDYEGVPNVILEAMAARVPVITTPAGGVTDVVADGQTGYIVPFDSREAMADRMVSFVHRPDHGRHLGEEGRRRLEESFAFAKLTERLLDTYYTIAQRLGKRALLRCLASHGRGV